MTEPVEINPFANGPAHPSPENADTKWIADLIRNEYDKAPDHYRMGDNWDDGAQHIADQIIERFRVRARQTASHANAEAQPRVTDNDRDEITVSLAGRELRGWSYKDDSERRAKMFAAREYVEGWCDGKELFDV